jgi:hypothetical protein
MDLDRYVSDLRSQLAAGVDVGDDNARALAERLSTGLDAAARLVLLEALSDAAAEITREIAPGSVDVRLRGREPELVVSLPVTPDFAETQTGPAEPVTATGGADDDDSATSRTTLRLPDQLKARVDRAAADEGISVNAWLVRAVGSALEPTSRRPAQRGTRGDSFTGWVS